MSLRFPHPLGSRPFVKKAAAGKKKKKTPSRQAWDSSIQDLTAHRATPEELAHRHEIHKSKNQSLAQWELKNKLLKKAWRRENGGTPDPLEDRRLALMMEILSDQYQMKDVLERSDRAMAVVKDLFGDAPRRHTSFPNVTMAPSCDLEASRGPIAQKKDPPTRLSILSESIMDSQALNEVEEIQSQDSDDDVDVSISFQPGLHTDKVHQMLNEESSRLTSEQWCWPKAKVLHEENSLKTPKGAGDPQNSHIALNATTAVKKVKTRLTEEEQEEPETSSVIGRVLNPQPINHKLQNRGKKKRPSHVSRNQTAAPPDVSTQELSGCSQSSLDVLNQMIQEVERELESYERQTGREVSSMPQAQGLTGFTLSLVSSIRRLVFYMKESDRRQCQESLERQRLKDELSEQRLLIDALTAEILAIKNSNTLSPGSYCLRSDQPQSSAAAMTGLPVASPKRTKDPTNTGSTHVEGFVTEHGSQSIVEHGDSAAPHPGYDTSSITQMTSFRDSGSLQDFQPAIMLSPPRQETRLAFKEGSSGILDRNQTASSSSGQDFPVPAHSSDPAALRRRLLPPAQSLPCAAAPQGDTIVGLHPTEPQALQSEGTNAAVTVDNDLVSWMSELTCQNQALKAQLKRLIHKTGDGSDSSRVGGENKQEAPSIQSPIALEMRIAELNRNCAEARDKLLKLIEQQKQNVVVSPAISPITPQQEEPGRRVRLIDAVIPMPQLTNSSVEETPSPGSGRRSSGSQRSNSSVSGSSRGGRAKVGKDKEEGWFALSTHVS